jgi:uncharacterized protein YdhG (YjbR/CyaY superfamily)
MKAGVTPARDIDAYIAGFPPAVQARLRQVRAIVRRCAPDAVEAIKYAMPTFVLGRENLVHFAAFAAHLGFYPTPSGLLHVAPRLSGYVHGKGSAQFPHNQPLPLDLIEEMVVFRVQEATARAATRPKKR